MTKILLILLCAICFAFTTSVQAQTNVWKSGGPEGGVVNAIAIDPSNPNTVYAGTLGGGLFKSTDGAANWSRINSGVGDLNISALAIARSNSQTLFAGSRNGFIYKSTNGGSTWDQVFSETKQVPITTLAIDPSNASTVYAGTLGSKIFITSNGGQSWTNSSSLISTHIKAIAIDPTNTRIVYAGGGGLFRSSNKGLSWSWVEIEPSATDISSVVIDPTDSRIIYAGSRRGARGEVYKSSDSGSHWGDAFLELDDAEISSIAIDPSDPNKVYAGATETIVGRPGDTGILKSPDKGVHWTLVDTGLGFINVSALAVSPSDGNAVYAGCKGLGILKSTDHGSSWMQSNSGLTAADVRSVVIDRLNPNVLYAGTNFAGVSKSTDRGESWTQLDFGVKTSNILALAIDTVDTNIVYVGTQNHGLFRSTDGGLNWAQPVDGTFGENASVFALAVDSINTNIVYASGVDGSENGLFKSTDKGLTWVRSVNLFPRVLVADPVSANTIYATSTESRAVKSTDGGRNFSPLSIDGANGLIRCFAIDPTNNQIVYVGIEGFGVFKSTDGGASWKATGPELLPRGPHALAIDPANPNIIYAGLSMPTAFNDPFNFNGIFVSRNAGASWSQFNPGLFKPLTYALAIDPSDTGRVYAGITGGVFRIQIGAGPSINIVSFNPPKSLKISGSGFTTSPRVVINGKDVSRFIVGSSDSTIDLKAKKKKLGLKSGENRIQVFDASGLPSIEFNLSL